jgi:acyl-CoA thioesterase FadM
VSCVCEEPRWGCAEQAIVIYRHLSRDLQAYWAWLAPTRGGGFTANLNVDYKAPLPARSWVCVMVDVVGIEGRKVRLSATLSDRPHDEDGATVFATATCLFIVAAKDS